MPSRPRSFTEAEIERLLSRPRTKICESDQTLLEVLVCTGIRLSELRRLNAEDLYSDWAYIRGRKGRKSRRVPLTKKVLLAIRPLRDCWAHPKDPVFMTAWGKRLSRQEVRAIVKGHLQAVGLPGSARWLRRKTAV